MIQLNKSQWSIVQLLFRAAKSSSDITVQTWTNSKPQLMLDNDWNDLQAKLQIEPRIEEDLTALDSIVDRIRTTNDTTN